MLRDRKIGIWSKKIYEMHMKFVYSDSTLSRLRPIFRSLTETLIEQHRHYKWSHTNTVNLDAVSFTATTVTDWCILHV